LRKKQQKGKFMSNLHFAFPDGKIADLPGNFARKGGFYHLNAI